MIQIYGIIQQSENQSIIDRVKKVINKIINDYARGNYSDFMYTKFFCGQLYMNIQRKNGE